MSDETFDATRRALVGSATLGAVMLGAFAGRAEAQTRPWTGAEQANVTLVNAFMAACQTKDLAGPMAFLSPECVYRMTETSPPDKGHEAITARLKSFVDTADAIDFQIFSTYAAGPIVINHRVDKFTSKVRPLLFEGVGVFHVQNGKIKEWTDYTIRAALANEWPRA